MKRRADYGAHIDTYISRQRPDLRALLEQLRDAVEAAAPKAEAAIKWGVPIFMTNGKMFCGLSASKAHVSLAIMGPRELFVDPDGLLGGESDNGVRLNLKPGDEAPIAAIKRWIKAALKAAK